MDARIFTMAGIYWDPVIDYDRGSKWKFLPMLMLPAE
jgi:hypothetical protein